MVEEGVYSMQNVSSESRGGLYIHVAYCRKKCIYCDFFSAGDRIADWHRYIDAVCMEFKERIEEMACPLRTVYIGGGTPSLMPADEFVRLHEAISPYLSEVEEFTIEVNPDDVCEEKLEIWKSSGVNRLSIGIQSFDDNVLFALGRRHDAATARRAYELSRRYFDNISIDLMFGLPGQTLEMWMKDLQLAIAMRPEHISAYSLMYEEGTPLTVMRDIGHLEETSDDISEKMFLILIYEMKKAGYDHYETSNFAKPGYRSRHNSSYWLQKPYLGLGPSAHSYDGRRKRTSTKADLKGYLDYWAPADSYPSFNATGSKDSIMEEEYLTDEELVEEYILTRLRTREGIDFQDFKKRFGEEEYMRLISRSRNRVKEGNIVVDDSHLSLAEDAVLISDAIITDLA